MRIVLWGLPVCLFVILFGRAASGSIIGKDDREDWFQTKSQALKVAARSVVALVEKDAMLVRTRQGYRWSSKVQTYDQQDSLCPGVRFAQQWTPAWCSGVLVTDRRVLTAGHCVKNADDLRKFAFVFDFYLTAPGRGPKFLRASQVFGARALIAHEVTGRRDWAVIELDRPVRGRTPIRIRRNGEPESQTPVVLLSFPRGLPLKIGGGARVADGNVFADPDLYFEANLDSFRGSSGGPVLNARTLELEGLMTVSFGTYEHREEFHPWTGQPCFRPRHFQNEAEATPPWILRASAFRRDALP